MSVDVTYVCEQTGETVVSSDGLPANWVIPPYSLVPEDKVRPVPPRHTVIAFSSKSAMDRYIQNNLAESFE